ncbi:hypothetical protein AAS21_gp150 [Pantoea phage vB_PagS_AAS21]|uniref:Uncharacterized protein n=1 Tax=Pantoea phage vB_PagS_AAS21 TaxID=2575261 RepID=A0A4Y5P1Q1_9CAUD|nr:hypothetical protein AAS21_gp150 [Pantoea phage vB_PagS_AAS21]
MALSLIDKLNSNTIGISLRDSLLFIMPIALLVNLVYTVALAVTNTPISGTYDGSVPYMYYELFLATFGARNIETD